jgi:hypothetical protein
MSRPIIRGPLFDEGYTTITRRGAPQAEPPASVQKENLFTPLYLPPQDTSYTDHNTASTSQQSIPPTRTHVEATLDAQTASAAAAPSAEKEAAAALVATEAEATAAAAWAEEEVAAAATTSEAEAVAATAAEVAASVATYEVEAAAASAVEAAEVEAAAAAAITDAKAAAVKAATITAHMTKVAAHAATALNTDNQINETKQNGSGPLA